MNLLDIVIAIILGYSLIRGVFRGLIKEVSSIIGVLAGYYGAYSYYPHLAALLHRWITDTIYLNIISFLILFIVILLFISILGVILKYLLSIAYLGWVDRVCGAAFGLIKGLLISAVIVVALTAFLPKNAKIMSESLLAPPVTVISENMAKIVPKDLRNRFSAKLEALKKTWHTHR
jgi:membrane protein required for colicin V production